MAVIPRAGEYDQVIQFESFAESDTGGITLGKTWTPVATVHAKVQQLRGREYFAQGQSQAPVDLRVVTRYRAGLDGSMRIRHGSAIYEVVGKPIVLGRTEAMEWMCVDRSGN